MKNRFASLYEALKSEDLLDSWEYDFPAMEYNETRRYTWDDGFGHIHQISITRFEDGTYERPIHYKR